MLFYLCVAKRILILVYILFIVTRRRYQTRIYSDFQYCKIFSSMKNMFHVEFGIIYTLPQ